MASTPEPEPTRPYVDAPVCGELPALRPRVVTDEVRRDAIEPRERILADEPFPATERTGERLGGQLFGTRVTDAPAEVSVDRVDVPIEDLPEPRRIRHGGGDSLTVGRVFGCGFEYVHT